MRNVKLILSYDGTDFHGWQTQPGLRTVQETLQDAIAELTGEERVRVNASGRTDTGVHAVGQVVNFHTTSKHPPPVLLRAVNARLPEDLLIRHAEEAAESFDANRDATRKLYRYVLHDGDTPDIFLRRYASHTRYKLDDRAMSRASSL
jgi:tRNA pseudouridine38-40 synthase